MLFIEYPKCSTCQRAKKWLDDRFILTGFKEKEWEEFLL